MKGGNNFLSREVFGSEAVMEMSTIKNTIEYIVDRRILAEVLRNSFYAYTKIYRIMILASVIKYNNSKSKRHQYIPNSKRNAKTCYF